MSFERIETDLSVFFVSKFERGTQGMWSKKECAVDFSLHQMPPAQVTSSGQRLPLDFLGVCVCVVCVFLLSNYVKTEGQREPNPEMGNGCGVKNRFALLLHSYT